MRLTDKSEFSRPMIRERKFDFESVIDCTYGDIDTFKEKIVISYIVNIDSAILNKHLEKGNIKMFIHLYSSKTMYRDAYPIDAFEGKLTLPRDEVYGDVEMSLILVSMKSQKLVFKNELKDIDDDNYLVKKGMIVAFANTRLIEIDYSKTKLEDLVVVIATEDPNRYNSIDIDNTVSYYMSKAEHSAFKSLYDDDNPINKHLAKIVHNAIYTRVLTKVIELKEVEDDEDEFFQSKIYEYIEKQFKMLEKNIRNISYEEINYYSMLLTNINFQEIVGEEDESI